MRGRIFFFIYFKIYIIILNHLHDLIDQEDGNVSAIDLT